MIISWPQTLVSGSEIGTERVGYVQISSFVQSHKRTRQTQNGDHRFKVTRGPDRHKMAITGASIFILRKKSTGRKEWHFGKSDWFTALMLLSDSLLYLIHPSISVTNIIPTGTLYKIRLEGTMGLLQDRQQNETNESYSQAYVSISSKYWWNLKVYWTVHHLDSSIKIDQLDVTCFIISLCTAQHVSNFSTSIFRSLRLIVDLFHVLYCSGSMCVGVTVWFGWG